jgi:hypothetical protein
VVQRGVVVAPVHVVEHGVPVAEGAALAVLAAEADGRAFEEERAEGERLGEAPVDRAALVGGGAAVEEALDLGLTLKPAGKGGEAADHRRSLRADAGGDGS